MLGRGLEPNSECAESGKKHTYGIDISHLQVSGKDGFSLWDFSGAVDSYVTHSYFLSTERTVYIIVLDLTQPIDELKVELEKWLVLIKNHNLGGKLVYSSNRRQPDIASFSNKGSPLISKTGGGRVRASTISNPTKLRDRLYSSTLRPSKSSSHALSPSRSHSSSTHTKSITDLVLPQSPTKSIETEILPLVLQVPVLVVGSHFDCLNDKAKKETVPSIDQLVIDASRRFQRSLNIIPQVFPISGGEKASSSEIRYLKEQLSTIRASLLEVCHCVHIHVYQGLCL